MRTSKLAITANAALLMALAACSTQHAAPKPGVTETAVRSSDWAPATKPKPVVPPIATFAEGVKRGDAAWMAGELDAALYMYVLALQLSPNDALTFAKVGAIHESQGNYVVARQAFERAHAADPKDARIAERLGLLYLKESKVDQAATMFTGALQREPGRWRALDGLAEVARARGNLDDALRYDDQALQAVGADRPTVLEHRGHTKLLLGDLRGAESDLRESIDRSSRPDASRYLAEVLVRLHDNASAYEILLRVMDMPSAYNRMGLILMSVPDYAAAADYFAKAVSTSPGWNNEAQLNLSVARERMAQAGTPSVAGNAAQ